MSVSKSGGRRVNPVFVSMSDDKKRELRPISLEFLKGFSLFSSFRIVPRLKVNSNMLKIVERDCGVVVLIVFLKRRIIPKKEKGRRVLLKVVVDALLLFFYFSKG